MTDILISMNNSGGFSTSGGAGRIEEYCAKRLKISLNSIFRASTISYYTLSFEPFSLSRKIITENIYKDSSVTTGIHYSDGYIFCPIYDYIAISPEVLVQIDAYELDEDGNVKSIIKSGIFSLEFEPSLTGEGMMLATVRPDVKFKENVRLALTEELKTMPLDGKNIIDRTIEARKIAPKTITAFEIADRSIEENLFKDGSIPTRAYVEASVTSEKLANSAVTSEKLTSGAVTTNKIASKNITSACIADKAITNAKLALHSVAEDNIRTLSVTSRCIGLKAVTPDKLDRKYLTQHQSLNGYATESWVKSLGFITDVSSKADKSEIPKKLSELKNDMAVSFLRQNLTDDEKEIARKNISAVCEVSGKGLSSNDFTDIEKEKLEKAITEHQSLDGYATESWVKEQGYISDISMKADKSDLSDVAFSGSYNDLKDLPTIECNFTEELKANYDTAFEHSQENHSPANAEENVIDGVNLNGTELPVNNKKIDLNCIYFVKKQFVFAEV